MSETHPPKRRREGAGPLARRANLSRLLRLVHHEGPMTRARLTQRMGINRSTVGDLVAELVELGLVDEGDGETRSVGRPSPIVRASDHPVTLTVNPDIDAVTIGIVGLGGHVLKRTRYPAAGRPTAGLVTDLVGAVLDGQQPELRRHHRLIGISVAVPGLVDGTGVVTYAPHLDWHREPIATMMTARTGLPCRAANDAQLGLLGERYFGAARGMSDVVYLNGSASGIGGAAVIGGIPVLGTNGFGGELGHTMVNPQGRACHCGRHGCLETEVTRTRLLAALGLADTEVEQLDTFASPEVIGETARAELEVQSRWLGQSLTDIVHIFDPEAIILGGFLATLYRATPDALTAAVRSDGFASLTGGVSIEAARLGANRLMVGAAELLLTQLLDDPAQSVGP